MAIHDHQDVKQVLAQIAAVNRAVANLWNAINGGGINELMAENYRAAAVILREKERLLERTLNEKIAEVAYVEACGG